MFQEKTQQAPGTVSINQQQPDYVVKTSMTKAAAWQEFRFRKSYNARKALSKIADWVSLYAEIVIVRILFTKPVSIKRFLKRTIGYPVMYGLIHAFIYLGANFFYGIYAISEIPNHVRRLLTKKQENEMEVAID